MFVQQREQNQLLKAPFQPLDDFDVSSLLNIPLKSLSCVEYKKPRKYCTAFNLFFRDEQPKLCKFLSSNPKYRKVSFGDMAKVLMAKWKATSELDRLYYHLRADEDKKRYEREMEEWNLKMAQCETSSEFLEPLDLPTSCLQSVFDEEPVVMPEQTPVMEQACQSGPTTSTLNVAATPIEVAPSVVSDVSETIIEPTRKERMETVYGAMPFRLLDDIGDDAPWPF